MLYFRQLLLIATFSLCFNLSASATPKASYWISNIWTAGAITMGALGSYYSYQARDQILNHDPDDNGTQSAARSLMGSTVTLGVSAALSTLTLCIGLTSQEKAPVAGAFSALATVVAVVPGITTAIAYGIEDNQGSTDPNLKISMGLSWTTWVANGIGAVLFILSASTRTTESHHPTHV